MGTSSLDDEGTYSLDDVTPLRESYSGKAILFLIPDLDEEVWVPKSAIHDMSEVWEADQEPGTLVVHEWFAEKRGWA